MSLAEPQSAAQPPPEMGPAFELATPPAGAPDTPLVFASPHSGRVYPAELLDHSRLDAHAIRRSEDAHVDRLLEGAAPLGVSTLTARYARAYIDLNRDPWELDPAMFEDALPPFARCKTARVAAGLGAIPRVVGAGREIYDRKLTLAQAQGRIEAAHLPYHQALADLLAERRARHGLAVLIDWHSMPSAAAKGAGRGADIVLGDRFGAACAASLTGLAQETLSGLGYRVARNAPYAGGYTTERHGRPGGGVHVLQIEINRGLYLDEASLEPTRGMARLKANIERLTKALLAGCSSL